MAVLFVNRTDKNDAIVSVFDGWLRANDFTEYRQLRKQQRR